MKISLEDYQQDMDEVCDQTYRIVRGLTRERESLRKTMFYMVHAVGEIRIPKNVLERSDITTIERTYDERTDEIVFRAVK